MAGIKATVTTDTFIPKEDSVEVEKTKKRKAAEKYEIDLSKCYTCEKKLNAFVAADGKRFCNDGCVSEYLS